MAFVCDQKPGEGKVSVVLKSAGVSTLVHYPVPPHLQEAYVEMGLAEGTYPITETIHREVLSLPIGPHLSSENAARVVEVVRSFDGNTRFRNKA